MKQIFLLILSLFIGILGYSQKTFPSDAVSDEREGVFAFTNATVFTDYQTKVENATLVIKKGKVVAVGQRMPVPAGAVVIDLKGKFVYPSFIDLYTNYGMPEPKAHGKRPERQPQELSNKEGAYSWNEALRPEYKANENFKFDEKEASAYRKSGFGTVLTHQHDGIARGSSALVCLGDEKENELIINGRASNHFSFNKGTSTQNYPSSLMGAIALLKQTYYDAQWYKNNAITEEYNISLEAWNMVQELPQIFEVRDRLEALRAAKIGREFGKKYIFMGSGDEYQRIKELKETGSAFIVPVDFPDPYDISDPMDALQIDLNDMLHWELASGNPASLQNAGITFALSTNGLKKKDDFLGQIRTAIEKGLKEENALKALTYTPARLIKAENLVGSLKTGMLANFVITSGNIFDKKTTIHHNWILGKPYILSPIDQIDLRGKYALKVGGKTYDLKVKGTVEKPKISFPKNDTTDITVTHSLSGNLISLSFKDIDDKFIRLSGLVQDKKWTGQGNLDSGEWVNWTASYQGEVDEKDSKKDKDDDDEIEEGEKDKKDDKDDKDLKNAGKKEAKDTMGKVIYPFAAYGSETLPVQKTYLIKGATVWTNEKEGILKNTDVLIKAGKIQNIGQNLSDPGAIIIDASGKHLTSGIIDEHSHIAISRGVNEGTQNSSAEVSISDVVNSEDVNIYRQLSGGVIASQLLHGSANPIGGQSAIIKLRWGYAPEEMKIKSADPFIKFALGENVKQSNWGDDYRSRFPQSRMGVEQVFYDNFTRAKEYGEAKKSGKAIRKDLELETLLEILESRRFVTCHSYVQSEINMLMKTAEAFGFRINTFTHILEGYKVADKMKAHGVGGSTFSDWWAYKYEVVDAIPHNAAIMARQGVVTAINSDDAEMGRRLNQEAAKSVMYADMPEEDAWKMVSLNPAKLLHIDNITGSIKKGKDADLVVWSDNPLSIYAKAEHTFVDGIRFYSKEEDLEKREWIQKERARLIEKMIKAKKNGGKSRSGGPAKVTNYHCDDIGDELRD